MHISLPLINFTQWKDEYTSYSFTTKILTHSMCQVSLVVKYICIHYISVRLKTSVLRTIITFRCAKYIIFFRYENYTSVSCMVLCDPFLRVMGLFTFTNLMISTLKNGNSQWSDSLSIKYLTTLSVE